MIPLSSLMNPRIELEPVFSMNTIPPEILHRIFKFLVRNREPDARPSTYVDDIRSVRLTCQRFCSLAPPLLIPEITVSMTEASLERFKTITSHQLISSGVRSVHVKLLYYDRFMASNLQEFAYFHIRGMNSQYTYLKSAVARSDSPMIPLCVMPASINPGAIELCTEIIHAWERVRTGDPDLLERDRQDHIKYRNILRDAHHEYQLLFQAQQKMRDNGTFLSSIASAVAKMPGANKLVITDEEDPNSKKNDYLNDRDYRTSMRAVMLAPRTWSEESYLYTTSDFEPPVELLHRLPAGIHKAGTTLRAMRIHCSRPSNYAKLSMSPSEQASLSQSIQDLKTLIFDAGSEKTGTAWYLTRQNDSKDIVFDFLSTFPQPSGLERLTIAFRECALGSNRLSKVLRGAHHKFMKQLRLTGVTLTAGELGQYLAHIQGPCDVFLKSAGLLNGTWTEEVDDLRSLSRVSITVSGLQGAEFDEMEFRLLWTPWEERELNRYLQRATSVNPFNKILYEMSIPSPVD